MEARYYNPENGRFLNVDPAFRDVSFKLDDPQSLNSYAYARNNPVGYVDRDGREPVSVIVGASIAWTAAASLAVQAPLWFYGTTAPDNQASQQLFNAQQAVGWGTLAALEAQAPMLAVPTFGVALNNANKQSVDWSQNNFVRGHQVDQIEGNNLGKNYPVADHMDWSKGVLRSNKSMDLNARTYQNNPGAVSRTMNRYVDQLSNFQGARYGGVNVNAANIVSRELRVVVPNQDYGKNMTSLFEQVRQQAIQKNVNVNIKKK